MTCSLRAPRGWERGNDESALLPSASPVAYLRSERGRCRVDAALSPQRHARSQLPVIASSPRLLDYLPPTANTPTAHPSTPRHAKAAKAGACGKPGPPNSGSSPLLPGKKGLASPASQYTEPVKAAVPSESAAASRSASDDAAPPYRHV